MTVTSPAGLLKIMSEFGRVATVLSSPGSSSVTAPTGTRLVLAEVWGAGGGGGAGTTSNWTYAPSGEPIFGPGGGGGAYACNVYSSVSGGTTVSYTVGSGGSGQAQPNQGSSTPRANSGGSSSVTIGGTTTTANGGQGAVSWLTESQSGQGFDIFNQDVGDGGSPNGNPGNVGVTGGTGGGGGAALSSAYTVNGLSNWFGTSSAGAGGNGGSTGGGTFTAGFSGSSGLVVLYFIGDVDPDNLTDFYRGGTFVPNASPNTGIATAGNISISSFVGAELNPACGSPPPSPPPPTSPPVVPPVIPTPPPGPPSPIP